MTVPKGGGPEDPTHLRQKVFAASFAAFLVGFILFLLFYPGSIPRATPVPSFFGGFLIMTFVPVLYAPVVLVHAVIFWWGSDWLLEFKPRLLVRAAVLTLVTIAGVGLYVQLASPALLFTVLPLAGLTAVGYLLGALGWWSAFRQDRVSGYHATPIRR